jgi:hypothetical protein
MKPFLSRVENVPALLGAPNISSPVSNSLQLVPFALTFDRPDCTNADNTLIQPLDGATRHN